MSHPTRPLLLRGLTLAVITAAAMAAAFLAGCYDGGPNTVEIRVRNAADVPLEEVVVMFPDEQAAYGDLGVGEASPYIKVGAAYRYAPVRALAAGDTVRATPIDYVGEDYLDNGRYTYRLDLVDGQYLTLVLEED